MSRKLEGLHNISALARTLEEENKQRSFVDIIKDKFHKLSNEVLETKRLTDDDLGVTVIGPNLTGEMLKVCDLIDEDTVLVQLLKPFPRAQLEEGEKVKLKLDYRGGHYKSDLLIDDSYIELFITEASKDRLFYAQKRNNDSGHAIGFDHYGFRS